MSWIKNYIKMSINNYKHKTLADGIQWHCSIHFKNHSIITRSIRRKQTCWCHSAKLKMSIYFSRTALVNHSIQSCTFYKEISIQTISWEPTRAIENIRWYKDRYEKREGERRKDKWERWQCMAYGSNWNSSMNKPT